MQGKGQAEEKQDTGKDWEQGKEREGHTGTLAEEGRDTRKGTEVYRD